MAVVHADTFDYGSRKLTPALKKFDAEIYYVLPFGVDKVILENALMSVHAYLEENPGNTSEASLMVLDSISEQEEAQEEARQKAFSERAFTGFAKIAQAKKSSKPSERLNAAKQLSEVLRSEAPVPNLLASSEDRLHAFECKTLLAWCMSTASKIVAINTMPFSEVLNCVMHCTQYLVSRTKNGLPVDFWKRYSNGDLYLDYFSQLLIYQTVFILLSEDVSKCKLPEMQRSDVNTLDDSWEALLASPVYDVDI